jgi:hypothetical protein
MRRTFIGEDHRLARAVAHCSTILGRKSQTPNHQCLRQVQRGRDREPSERDTASLLADDARGLPRWCGFRRGGGEGDAHRRVSVTREAAQICVGYQGTSAARCGQRRGRRCLTKRLYEIVR